MIHERNHIEALPFVVDDKRYHCEINLFQFADNGERILSEHIYQNREDDHDDAVTCLVKALNYYQRQFNEPDLLLEATISYRLKAATSSGYCWVVEWVDVQGKIRQEVSGRGTVLPVFDLDLAN